MSTSSHHCQYSNKNCEILGAVLQLLALVIHFALQAPLETLSQARLTATSAAPLISNGANDTLDGLVAFLRRSWKLPGDAGSRVQPRLTQLAAGALIKLLHNRDIPLHCSILEIQNHGARYGKTNCPHHAPLFFQDR